MNQSSICCVRQFISTWNSAYDEFEVFYDSRSVRKYYQNHLPKSVTDFIAGGRMAESHPSDRDGYSHWIEYRGAVLCKVNRSVNRCIRKGALHENNR